MLKVVFTENGEPVSDFKAKETAKNIIETYLKNTEKEDFTVYISNECLLESFALYTMMGMIGEEEIEFYFEDIRFNFNKIDGLIFPEGVIPTTIYASLVEEAIKVGYENMLKEQKND